jgi:hypothetical protein
MAKKYEIIEKDIDSAIRWLQIHDPEHATPEDAIGLLETLQQMAHQLGHVMDEEAMLRAQKELEAKRNR